MVKPQGPHVLCSEHIAVFFENSCLSVKQNVLLEATPTSFGSCPAEVRFCDPTPARRLPSIDFPEGITIVLSIIHDVQRHLCRAAHDASLVLVLAFQIQNS